MLMYEDVLHIYLFDVRRLLFQVCANCWLFF